MRVFLHLTKTAGTTLVQVLRKVYGTDRIYHNDAVYADARALAEAVLKLSPEERGHIEIVCGHIAVGIHMLLPGDTQYLTILRDPVERLISTYYYLREQPPNPLYEVVHQYPSLSEFVRSGVVKDMDNGQTRRIAGFAPGVGSLAPYGGCTDEMLQEAKRNLRERFCFVGLTEQFPQSLMLLKNVLNWKRVPLYESLNVTGKRPAKDEISKEDMDTALEYTVLDRALYAYAKERLDDQIARQDACFARDVETFVGDLREYQALCRKYADLEQDYARLQRHALTLDQGIQEITSTRLWRWSRPMVRLLGRGNTGPDRP
jgi:hypothetical protein